MKFKEEEKNELEIALRERKTKLILLAKETTSPEAKQYFQETLSVIDTIRQKIKNSKKQGGTSV